MLMKYNAIFAINCSFFLALVISTFLCTGQANAEKSGVPKYEIVFDAGSSKTRASVYQIVGGTPLKIIPLLDEDMKIPLSDFSDYPDQATEKLIQPLLDKVKKFLLEKHNSDLSEVNVSVLGTAGMRKIPLSKQKKIYQFVSKSVSQSNFSLGEFRTISGDEEGMYAWVNINYLTDSFNKEKTHGVVEVGGASAQLAFETNVTENANVKTISINKKKYNVYSISFLGLGTNDIVKAMREKPERNSCYPKGYDTENIHGAFSFDSCTGLFDQLLSENKFNGLKEIPSLHFKNQDFFGVSGLYHTLKFFDVITPTRSQLIEKAEAICNNGYDAVVEYSKGKDQHDTFNKCASAAFVESFLFNNLKIEDSKLQGVKKIKDADLRWTLGYVFLRATPH